MGKLKHYLFTKKSYRFLIRDWLQLPDLQGAADLVNTLRFNRNLRSVELEKPPGKRILVIAPHIDDETIGPGGALLKSVEAGASVQVLFVTSDDNPEGGRVREAEARDVAAQAGFNCQFLGWKADAIAVDGPAVDQFCQAVTSYDPDLLMVTFVLDDHDDHRRVNELLYKAFATGRLNPKLDVWAYQVYTAVLANVVVDITEKSEQKRALIRRYVSQMRHRDWANFALGLNAWNSRFLKSRSSAAFAECFFTVPLAEYVVVCEKYLGNQSAPVYANKAYRD
ncbi:MAG: PIG-L family deacetylase [Magnetococcales bacterium]|nr:PIG-L family deacetylase [Magnetococcales bacterium]